MSEQPRHHPYSGISTIKASGILVLRACSYFFKMALRSLRTGYKLIFMMIKRWVLMVTALFLLQSRGLCSNPVQIQKEIFGVYEVFEKPVSAQLNAPLPGHWNNADNTTGVNWGGLLLGLFLPVIGIFLAQRKKNKALQNRRKWAVIGSAISLGLILIALISKKTKF